MFTKDDFTDKFCDDLILKYGNQANAVRALVGRAFTHSGKPASFRTIKDWFYYAKIDSLPTVLPEKVPPAVASPARPNIIRFSPSNERKTNLRRVVIISDAQIGFLKDLETQEIEPIHDPQAMRVAELITHHVNPDEVVYIGDWMDLSFCSRWQQHDEFDAVNESIRAGYDWLCRFKAASQPGTKHVMISGNHDIRLEKLLLENNRKALQIKRASDTSSWPVFSMPYLLRFDELGIETPGYYPGGEYYITPTLVATHAPPKAKEFQASVIHGHTHHVTRESFVQHSKEGRHTYYKYDIGCLCQLGSTTNPRRLIRTRVPSDRPRTDWQQGIAVVNIDVETGRFSVDQVSIENGEAIYEGSIFRAGPEEV